jgi:hypothetical protein
MKQLKLFCLIIALLGLIPGNSVWARGEHGGGGHKAVGTCQVPVENWEAAFADILKVCKED